MQCERVQLELHAFLQGEMPPNEQAAIEEHLSACRACSEEAAAMKEFGKLLSQGLKEWVDQGVCPPQLARQIELTIRPVAKKAWWKGWPTYVGAASAAAAVFLVIMASRMQLPQELASVPLVGTLAAQLVFDDPPTPVAAEEKEGTALTIHKLDTASSGTRIQYSLKPTNGGTERDLARYQPQLSGPNGPLALRQLNQRQRDGGVLFDVVFDPVPAGQPLTFTVSKPADQGNQVFFQITLHK